MYCFGLRKKARDSPGEYYGRYIFFNCDVFPIYFKQIIEMLYLYQSSKKKTLWQYGYILQILLITSFIPLYYNREVRYSIKLIDSCSHNCCIGVCLKNKVLQTLCCSLVTSYTFESMRTCSIYSDGYLAFHSTHFSLLKCVVL